MSTTTDKKPIDCAQLPCSSCPYRRDVPSGIWVREELEKLPEYDENGMCLGIFLCHQTNATGRETMCRGWLTVAADSIAVRLGIMKGDITVEQRDAPVAVPLYATGSEACAAGMRDIDCPSPEAKRLMDRLLRKGAGKQGRTKKGRR